MEFSKDKDFVGLRSSAARLATRSFQNGTVLRATSTVVIALRVLARTRTEQKAGGGERDRTDDLLNANQMLSQLSYTP